MHELPHAGRGPVAGGAAPLPSVSQHPVVSVTYAIDRAIAAVCRLVLLVTGTALMGVLSANVIARYALSTGGFDWAEEVPEQLFPWFVMAGVALAVQHGGHIAVEWLLGRLDRSSTRIVLLMGHVLVIVSYLAIGWLALGVADVVAVERSPALGLPKTYGYWAVAGGCVLLALSTLMVALRIAIIGPEALPRPGPEEVPT